MRNVCVVITARPSYSRVKSVLSALKSREDVRLQIVVAASALVDRTGRVVEVIKRDGFLIDAEVSSLVEGDSDGNMVKTTALALLELPSVFLRLRPSVVVVVADRYETIATSIAASYMRIPVAHIQGGEVTGNIDERVRHANTKLADVHLVASETAQRRVLKMGEDPSRVFLTGCPSVDLARDISPDSPLGFDPFKKYGGVGEQFATLEKFIVVLQHPVTNEVDQSQNQIRATLEAVTSLGLPTLWFWPNVDAGSDRTSKTIRSFRELKNPRNIHFFKNMEPEEFLRLINKAGVLVGNSSVGVREAGYLGVPVVNIGSRQSGRERAKNVIDCSYGSEEIKNAIEGQLRHGRYEADHIYGNGTAGSQIAEILATCNLSSNKQFYDSQS